MANLWLPPQTDLALALREPNLLVPGSLTSKKGAEVDLAKSNEFAHIATFFDTVRTWSKPRYGYTSTFNLNHPTTPDRIGANISAESLVVSTEINGLSDISSVGSSMAGMVVFRNSYPDTVNWFTLGRTNTDEIRLYPDTDLMRWYLENNNSVLVSLTETDYPVSSEHWYSVVLRYATLSSGLTSRIVITNLNTRQFKVLEQSPSADTTYLSSWKFSYGSNRTALRDMSFALFGLALGPLSDARMDSLSRNPWQLFKPANDTPYLISVPTGSATVTLSSPTATATGTTTATVGCTVTYT